MPTPSVSATPDTLVPAEPDAVPWTPDARRKHRRYRTTATAADMLEVVVKCSTGSGVTRPELREHVGDLAPTTVDRVLGVLVRRGYLRRSGERRGTRYDATDAGLTVLGSDLDDRWGQLAAAVTKATPVRRQPPGSVARSEAAIAFRAGVLAYLSTQGSAWTRARDVAASVKVERPAKAPRRPFGTPLDTTPPTPDASAPTRTQVNRALTHLVEHGHVETKGVRAGAVYRVRQ